MNNIKLSVIIPVYNAEKYLRETLDSLLSQTMKDFEVLLIDDGSQNSSPAICDEAARVRFAENGTFNAFKTEYFTQSRIDHVFVSPATQVEAYGILTNSYWTENDASGKSLKSADAPQEISFDTYTRKNPSDHYPVFVRIVF